MTKTGALHYASIVSLIALALLCIAWEGKLAPLRPGGSMLILKALPLLLPLLGILRGKIYTYQWSSMLVLLYLAEGMVRAMTDKGLSATLALAELGIATVFFFSAIFYVRSRARGKA